MTRFDTPLLDAKFAVPTHTIALVNRARLLERLDVGVQGPLTLVSAPAGTGKTVLASSWSAARRARGSGVTWISLEPDDERSGVFWSGVLEALSREGVDVAGVGKPAGPGRVSRRLLSRLAATIAARTDPLVVVLDDADLLAEPVLAEDVEFLLHQTNSRLRLVLLTRVDPGLPLHRYRIAGAITEIRNEDLAFTDAEASTLFAQAGLRLSATRVAELMRRTEGWAAALRFAELSAQTTTGAVEPVIRIAGDEGNVFEYLIAEVLDRQPAVAREALLRTSVVDILRPGLFEVLSEQDGTRVLPRLAHGNAFVQPVDGLTGCYRYHTLFREFLRAQLAYEQPDAVPRLHRAAAHWLADHGFLIEAVRHAIAAGAWTEAARHVVDNLAIGTLLSGVDHGSLAALFSQLPAHLTDPSACVIRAAAALSAHDSLQAGTDLELAEKQADIMGPADEGALRLACSVLAVVRARMDVDVAGGLAAVTAAEKWLLRSEAEHVTAPAELRALLLAHKAELLLWAGDVAAARIACAGGISAAQAPGCESLLASCLSQLALIEATQGCLGQAAKLADRAGAVAERSGSRHTDTVQAADVALAWVLSEQGDIREAGRLLRRATASMDTAGPAAVLVRGLVQARLLRHRADPDAAVQRIQDVRASFAEAGLPSWGEARLTSEEAASQIVRGRPDLAAAVAHRLRNPHLLEGRLVLMQTALARGDTSSDEVLVTALRGAEVALDTRVTGWLVESERLLARGLRRPAAAALLAASRLAEAERLRRPFLEASPAVRQLLREDRELAGRLRWLKTTNVSGPDRRTPAVRADTHPGLLVAPLTEREHEVLSHLADLLTTAEVAAAMFLSVNTVKTHVRSILRKLSATRRNEAVRRARDLHLLAG